MPVPVLVQLMGLQAAAGAAAQGIPGCAHFKAIEEPESDLEREGREAFEATERRRQAALERTAQVDTPPSS